MKSLRLCFHLACFYVSVLLLAGCARSSLPATLTTEIPAISTQTEAQPTSPPAPDAALAVAQSPALLPEALPGVQALSGLTHYELILDVNVAQHTFQGQARVRLVNSETVPLDSLYFRLLPNAGKSYGNGWLHVGRSAVDGIPVEGRLSVADTVLEIPLLTPLAPGAQAEVRLEFSGLVPQDFGVDGDASGYGIYNYSQGVLALSGWYPILAVYDEDGWNLDPASYYGDSVYSDSAFYSVELSVPADQIVAATGVEVEQSVAGEQVRHRYVSGPVRDFFLVMSPEFEVRTQQVGGVAVNAFSLPEHRSTGTLVLDTTAESLAVFSEKFGAYPFVELDVVEAPMQRALGVEYPGIFLIASDLYKDAEDISLIITVAHETAHQWWYSVVGNDVFDEPWLDEALATYSSAVYLEASRGRGVYQGYLDYLEERYEKLVSDGLDEPVTRPLAYFEAVGDPRVYGTVVYTKGALFLLALRRVAGDQAFFEGLKQYYQQNQYAIARGDTLLQRFNSASEKPLDDLYQKWLSSP